MNDTGTDDVDDDDDDGTNVGGSLGKSVWINGYCS